MSKYSLETVQKPFKQGLKTPSIEIQGQLDPKTNYITGFTIVLKNKKKEERKLIKVDKGNVLKSWESIKQLIKGKEK